MVDDIIDPAMTRAMLISAMEMLAPGEQQAARAAVDLVREATGSEDQEGQG